MAFSKRRINAQSLAIFKQSGRVMTFWVRDSSTVPVTPPRFPDSMLGNLQTPAMFTGNYHKKYIFAKYEPSFTEEQATEGRISQGMGMLIVPVMYQKILAMTEQIDPYQDGTLFEKVPGASPDQEGIFIKQKIRQVYNPVLGQVQV